MKSSDKTLMWGGLGYWFAQTTVHFDWVDQNSEEMKLLFKH